MDRVLAGRACEICLTGPGARGSSSWSWARRWLAGGRRGTWQGPGASGVNFPAPRDHVLARENSHPLARDGQIRARAQAFSRARPWPVGSPRGRAGGGAAPVVTLTHHAPTMHAHGSPFGDRRVPLVRDGESDALGRRV